MRYYINKAVSAAELTRSLPDLIPDAAMRRRMSKMVRMGVATGMECLGKEYPADSVDAIITATGLGCLEDSEKFLRNLTENDERLLNPTPFIQSTFNTVGAQIGLLCRNHCYNMTYAHRGRSFESALLDAMLLFDGDMYRNILVGAVDYTIPAQLEIMQRMGFWRKGDPGEGAFFFLISDQPGENCLGVLTDLQFLSNDEQSEREVSIYNDYEQSGIFPTASAAVLFDALQQLKDGRMKEVRISNSYRNELPSIMTLECI